MVRRLSKNLKNTCQLLMVGWQISSVLFLKLAVCRLFYASLISFVFSLSVSANGLQSVASQEQLDRDNKQIEQLDKSHNDWGSLQLSILNISEQWVNNEKAIVVTFTHELAEKTDFNRFMTVTEDKIAVKGKWQLMQSAPNSVSFSPIKPDKHYEVFVRPGIQSKKSLQLLKPTHYSVPTESFVPSLEFSANALSLAANKAHRIQVRSAGVKQLDIKLFKITDQNKQALWEYWQEHPDLATWDERVLSLLDKPLQQERFAYEVEPQKRQSQSLNWFDGDPEEKGAYVVQIRSQVELADRLPELKVHYYWFNVSDILFSTEQYQSELMISLFDRQTGKLLKDVPVLVGQAQQSTELKTSKDGLVRLEKSETADRALFLATLDGDISLYQQYLTHFQQTPSDHDIERHSFLTLSKQAYGLNESLRFDALMGRDGEPMAHREIEVFIQSLNDASKHHRQWQMTDELGYMDVSIPLEEGFDYGKWQLQLKLPESSETLASQNFFIWSKAKPAFGLNLSLNAKNLSPNQTDVLNIRANLPNKEAKSSKVEVRLKRIIKWHNDLIRAFPKYQFGEAEDVVLSGQEALESVVLTESGTAEVKLAAIRSRITSPLMVMYKGELLVNGYVVAESEVSQLFLPEKEIVGVKAIFDQADEEETNVTFRVIKTNAKRELLKSGSLAIRLIRLDEDLGIEIVVAEPYLKFEKGQMGTLTLPVSSGNYRLEIVDSTTALKTVYPFSVGDAGMSSENDDFRLNFDHDNFRYAPGEELSLTLSGNVDSEVLVTLVDDKVLWQRHLASVKPEQHLSIPIDEKWFDGRLSRELMLSVVGWQYDPVAKQFERVTASSPVLLEQNPESLDVVYDESDHSVMFQLSDAEGKVGIMAVMPKSDDDSPKVQISPVFFGSTGWTKISLKPWLNELDQFEMLRVHLHFKDQIKDIYLNLDSR